MKIGISTSIFWKTPTDISNCFAVIKKAGFDFVELDCHNLFNHISSSSVQKIKNALRETDLKVSSAHMPYFYPLSSPEAGVRKSAVKSYKKTIDEFINKIFEFSYIADSLTLVFHPGVGTEKIERESQQTGIEKGIKELYDAIGSDARFKLAFENMLSSHFGSKPEELNFIAGVMNSFNENNSGLCFDSCHAAYDYAPHDFLESIIENVVSTHLSDNYRQSEGEFHAVPMSIIHSKTNWKKISALLSNKIECAIIELSKPPAISFDAYLKMAKISADELAKNI